MVAPLCAPPDPPRVGSMTTQQRASAGPPEGREGGLRREQELARAHEALVLAERRLRQVIDLVPHFVFAKDLEGRFLFVNQAVAEAYGTTVEDLRGRTDADFASSPDEVAHFRADDLEVIRGGKAKDIPEETITDASGRVRRLHTTKIPFTYSGTTLPAVLGVAVDVTEKRRLEAQLVQAQKMEGLGRLAGGVAHDFNNLLTVILGYAQLAEQSTTLAEARENAAKVHDAATRAGALTGRLLTFARGQAGAPKVLDVGALVRDLAPLLRRAVGEGVRFEITLQPGVLKAEVDPSQLEQVLVNLVVNARDAMPHGGKIVVATRSRTAEQARVEGGPLAPHMECVALEVRDTGTGMDAATMARIFEPFFTTKGAEHGTGLGLPTCYGVVKRAGGHIWAESTPGAGSTFHILLPVCDRELTPRTLPSTGPAGPAHGETVLVADDDDAVRNLAVTTLSRKGYRVLAAADAGEALGLARRHPEPIDLLVTDVVMPMTSGTELARLLLIEHPRTRVLYVTACDDEHPSCNAEGDDQDLLRKPFAPDDLARAVREALDRPTE
jgi:two-component system, cell cycle sensor histidine kinase and response regulator CckA